MANWKSNHSYREASCFCSEFSASRWISNWHLFLCLSPMILGPLPADASESLNRQHVTLSSESWSLAQQVLLCSATRSCQLRTWVKHSVFFQPFGQFLKRSNQKLSHFQCLYYLYHIWRFFFFDFSTATCWNHWLHPTRWARKNDPPGFVLWVVVDVPHLYRLRNIQTYEQTINISNETICQSTNSELKNMMVKKTERLLQQQLCCDQPLTVISCLLHRFGDVHLTQELQGLDIFFDSLRTAWKNQWATTACW